MLAKLIDIRAFIFWHFTDICSVKADRRSILLRHNPTCFSKFVNFKIFKKVTTGNDSKIVLK